VDVQSLKRAGLLADLTDDELRIFASCARLVPFKKDDEVLHQGQRNASLFIVEAGLLHVRARSKGHDVLLGRMEPGSFFGEISLLDPGPTTAAVCAVTDGQLLEVGRAALDQFITRCPQAGARLLLHILEGMASRLRHTDEHLVDAIMWGGLLK
jgi:CRP-like cAMP-binding protein